MYRLPPCLCLPIRLPWCFPPTELLTFVLRSKKPSEMSAHKIHKVIVCSKIKMGEKSLSLVVIVVVESDFAIQLDILSLVVRLEWYLPNENEHRQPLVFYCSLTTGLPKNTLPRAISSITERKSQEFPTLSIIFFFSFVVPVMLFTIEWLVWTDSRRKRREKKRTTTKWLDSNKISEIPWKRQNEGMVCKPCRETKLCIHKKVIS